MERYLLRRGRRAGAVGSSMLIPAFNLDLNNPILRGLATVGKLDGKHPSLTCATSAGKIFFHSPHEKDPKDQLRFLNINRRISAIACGKLNPKIDRELLLVGAQTTLLAYDVLENSDLFFKDAPDGVNAIVIGAFAGLESPLALVGGNCSIQGFDSTGNEAFWTVTGDNVSTMAFCDVDEDGELELLVGSDDFEIRVFRNEEVTSETTETDRIVALTPIRNHTFGYALANGTVGVYSAPGQRRWRVKAKHEVTCITGYDLDGDGQPELISGWSNGKFEVRSDTTGEVIFKDYMRDGHSVSGILRADYRGDGRTEVIVCSAEGEVRGYLPAGEELAAMVNQGGMADKLEDETLQELNQRKQELLFELRQYASSGAHTGHMHMHTHMHVLIHMLTHTYTRTRTCTCTCTCTCTGCTGMSSRARSRLTAGRGRRGWWPRTLGSLSASSLRRPTHASTSPSSRITTRSSRRPLCLRTGSSRVASPKPSTSDHRVLSCACR